MLATTLSRPTAWWHGGKNIAAFELLATWCQDCWCSASLGWFMRSRCWIPTVHPPFISLSCWPNLNAPESSAWGRTRLINWFCCYLSPLYFSTSFSTAEAWARVHMLSLLYKTARVLEGAAIIAVKPCECDADGVCGRRGLKRWGRRRKWGCIPAVIYEPPFILSAPSARLQLLSDRSPT